MTVEEAKEILQTYHDIVIGDDGTKIDQAIKVAIKALENQIPKSPLIWRNPPCGTNWLDGDWGYECPCCGNQDINCNETGNHHCICGQALDWSDFE